MKKIIALCLCSILACAFVFSGCGNNQQPATQPAAEETPAPETAAEAVTEAVEVTEAPTEATEAPAEETAAPEEETEAPEEAADQPLAGGWTVLTDQTPNLTDEERALFDKAMTGQVGVDFEPIAVIATQVVAGTNYAYLCVGTVVAPDAQPAWHVVTVYANLEGGAECIGITDLDIVEPKVIKEFREDITGGWTAREPGGKPVMLSDEDAQVAFDEAVKDVEQFTYYPIALLGKQIVAGTNYKILCQAVSTKGDVSIYILTIYADLQGNSQIESAFELDLPEYCGQF